LPEKNLKIEIRSWTSYFKMPQFHENSQKK
jgi:hypothetical protein